MSVSKNIESEKYNEIQSNNCYFFTKKDLVNMKNILKDELVILNKLKINVPNFLVIVVQKGGTTWLHENLKSQTMKLGRL